MKRFILFIVSVIVVAACVTPKSQSNKKTIFVTIAPLQRYAEELTCGDFDVELLVKQGASPETFEPTSADIAALQDAKYLFTTGLISFEQNLIRHIDNVPVVDLSPGIATLAGSCSHHHCNHAHGIDPHIWTSPRELRTMVSNMRDAIIKDYPDSTKYREAAARVIARIDSLDNYCTTQLSGKNRTIMIYHPAYTYLAHHYGVEQIAIENEGKEPSPRHLVELVETGRAKGIKSIFHQPQYSEDKLRSIAEELGAEIVITDPLALDIESEIRRIVNIIAE